MDTLITNIMADTGRLTGPLSSIYMVIQAMRLFVTNAIIALAPIHSIYLPVLPMKIPEMRA